MVARAYVDQLTRSKAITPERAAAVTAACRRADKVKAGSKDAPVAAGELTGLASALEADAGAASGHDQARLRSLGSLLKERASALH